MSQRAEREGLSLADDAGDFSLVSLSTSPKRSEASTASDDHSATAVAEKTKSPRRRTLLSPRRRAATAPAKELVVSAPTSFVQNKDAMKEILAQAGAAQMSKPSEFLLQILILILFIF